MRTIEIKGIEIYGFGKWTDQIFSWDDTAFIRLYGENEAGKSTLQQFILYMLFGLPPRKRSLFQPKQSSRLGGKLTLLDQTIGEYTIERMDGEVICYLPDGTRADESWLREQLGGLTRDMYESIYTFSALDLEGIQKMDETALSNVLFSVGLTGATHIYELEKQLDLEIGKLFKPTGTRPMINEQLTQIEKSYDKLQQFKKAEASYHMQIEERASILQGQSEGYAALRQAKQESDKYNRIAHALPTIEEFYMTEELLEKSPKEVPFPKDGLDRYEKNKAKIIPLLAKKAALENAMKENEVKTNAYQEKALAGEVKKQVQDVLAEEETVRNRLFAIEQKEKEGLDVEKELEARLMDIELNEADMKAMRLPFHLEKTWHDIYEQNKQITEMKEAITEAREQHNQQVENVHQAKLQTEATLLPQAEVERMHVAIASYEKSNERTDTAPGESAIWSRWQQKREKTAKSMLYGTIAVAALLFIVGFFTNALVLSSVAVGLLLIGGLQFLFSRFATKDIEEMTRREAGPVENQLTPQQYVAYKAQLAAQEESKTRLKIIADRGRVLHEAMEEWEETKRLYDTRLTNYMALYKKEVKAYPFLQQLAPAHWLELLRIMRETKEIMEEKASVYLALQQLKAAQDTFTDQLLPLAEALDVDVEDVDFSLLHNCLTENEVNEQLWKEVAQANRTHEQALEEIISEIELYETEEAKLFDYAQVDTEEAYVQVAHQNQTQANLREKRDKLLLQLEVSFDAHTKEELVQRSFDVQQVAYLQKEVRETIEGLENELEVLRKRLVEVEHGIQLLESSDDYSKASYTYQIEKDKLQQDSETWAVLKVMQTALAEAKKAYKERYLTEIIEWTTNYFKTMTDARYIRVYAPTDKQGFQVERATKDRYGVEELSQGSVDQLYVALRLAISKVMSDKYVVPLIIDDAFIHFDSKRTEKSIAILNDISREQQVFLFTCRRSIAELTDAMDITNIISV